MSFKLCPRETSTSSVWSSVISFLNPGSAGGVPTGSLRLNTNISVWSLRSTFAMVSRSMMRPPSMMAMLRHRFSASSR